MTRYSTKGTGKRQKYYEAYEQKKKPPYHIFLKRVCKLFRDPVEAIETKEMGRWWSRKKDMSHRKSLKDIS